MKLWTMILVLAVAVFASDAFAAKRLGGGKSFGQQSSNVTKREATTPPAAPAGQNAAAKPAATPAAAPAAAAPKRPWGAMLGGLAAGLGLAWLASSLGLGAEFGQIIMFALLAFVLVAALGWFMRRKSSSSAAMVRSPYAFEGASAGAQATAPVEPKGYNPANLGNDASARPWERQSMAFDVSHSAQQGSMIGAALRSPLEGSQTWAIPTGFDSESFINAAKQNFITLQAAWDRADVAALRAMMTDDMLKEIQSQLMEREQISSGATTPTEVMMLNAQLLGIEELPSHHMASVEFSGMIREDAAGGPAPFREVWNMTKARDGSSGWLVAGLQALQ